MIKRAKWIWLVFFVMFSLWISSVVFVERYLTDYWIELSSYRKHWLWASYMIGSTYVFFKFKSWLDLKYRKNFNELL